MNEPKSHHFVPRANLDLFADSDGKLYVYDKSKLEFRKQNPKKTACENFRYSLIDDKGNRDNTIEKLLSKVESKAIELIRKIDKGHEIEGEEFEILATYVTLQFTRVPHYQKRYNQFLDRKVKEENKQNFDTIDKVAILINEFEKQIGGKIELTPEELFKSINSDGDYKFESTQGGYVINMIESAIIILGYLYNMNWSILYSHNGSSFITSDNPFCILSPKINDEQQGIASDNVLKIMALSPKSMIFVGSKGQGMIYKKLSKKETRMFNICIAENMERYLFAPNEALLKSIVQKVGEPYKI